MVDGCRRFVRREPVDRQFVFAVGGPASDKFFDGESHADAYWLRVWGLRGLLWAWDDAATPEIRLGLDDEAWQVREMALKVISRHLLEDFTRQTSAGRHDPVARVERPLSGRLST